MIKVLLVAGLAGIAYLVVRGRPTARNLALKRLLALTVLMGGATAVIFPDLTVVAANLVGVQRGTDLVLYLFVVTFGFTSVSLFQRLRRLEEHNAELTRALALESALRDDAKFPATFGDKGAA
jgi:hypothetical protein